MKRRKYIPVGVKLQVALLALGFDPDGVEWDHDPALGLRPMNDAGTDTVPPANDPKHITIRVPSNHKRKTFGKPATTAGSDIHAIAHAKRLAKKWAEFWQRMNTPIEITVRVKDAKPKRKIQSRGFAKGHRPLRSRNDLRKEKQHG